MVKIVATGNRVPFPGLPPIVGKGKNARRSPHRYVEDKPVEVSLSDNQGYWGRRLVKKEVALVEDTKPKKPTTKPTKDKDK
jgi:hypothetical protein